jgi:hypothetical protein
MMQFMSLLINLDRMFVLCKQSLTGEHEFAIKGKIPNFCMNLNPNGIICTQILRWGSRAIPECRRVVVSPLAGHWSTHSPVRAMIPLCRSLPMEEHVGGRVVRRGMGARVAGRRVAVTAITRWPPVRWRGTPPNGRAVRRWHHLIASHEIDAGSHGKRRSTPDMVQGTLLQLPPPPRQHEGRGEQRAAIIAAPHS